MWSLVEEYPFLNAKKCDPRSHSVQSRGDVDVVLGGSVDHFTRPEGLRRREPMCPVLKSGGGLKENTKLLYQLIMKSLLLSLSLY